MGNRKQLTVGTILSPICGLRALLLLSFSSGSFTRLHLFFGQHSAEGLREALWRHVDFLCAAVTCPLLFLQILTAFSTSITPTQGGCQPRPVSPFCATPEKLCHISKLGSCGVCFIRLPSLKLQPPRPVSKTCRVFFFSIRFIQFFSYFGWEGKSGPSYSILSGSRSGFKWYLISLWLTGLEYCLCTEHVSHS